MNLQDNQNAGLYVHIPFCVKKCPYCDFYSMTDLSLKPRFLKALLAEMKLVSSEGFAFDTLYIGGGTPSVLALAEIETIVTSAWRYFNFLPDVEVTIEVNPGTVTLEQLRGLRRAGINRLNIGVQSLQQRHLDFLERAHTAKQARDAIADARRSGFENIGFDLIYGLPGQSQQDWKRDLEQAIDRAPQHLSCYMLTYEKGTPFYRGRQEGRTQPLNDLRVRLLFEETIDYLTTHGYDHYEISNFARTPINKERSNISRHNLKYWSMAPYFGLGPSAHSFVEPARFWNFSNVISYCTEIESGRLPIAAKELLSAEQLVIEAIYLGMRTTAGINIAAFNRKFDLDFGEIFKETIRDLQKKGLIEADANTCALSRGGMAFLDSIAAVFINQEITA